MPCGNGHVIFPAKEGAHTCLDCEPHVQWDLEFLEGNEKHLDGGSDGNLYLFMWTCKEMHSVFGLVLTSWAFVRSGDRCL